MIKKLYYYLGQRDKRERELPSILVTKAFVWILYHHTQRFGALIDR